MRMFEQLDQDSHFVQNVSEIINRNPKYAVYDSLTNFRQGILNSPEALGEFESAIELFKDSAVQSPQEKFESICAGVANLIKAASTLDIDKVLTPGMFKVLEQAFGVNKEQLTSLASKYKESSLDDISNEIRNSPHFRGNTTLQAMLTQLSDTFQDFLHSDRSNALHILGKAILSVVQSEIPNGQGQAINNITSSLPTSGQYYTPN